MVNLQISSVRYFPGNTSAPSPVCARPDPVCPDSMVSLGEDASHSVLGFTGLLCVCGSLTEGYSKRAAPDKVLVSLSHGKTLKASYHSGMKVFFFPSSSYSFNGFHVPKYKHQLASYLQILSFVIWKYESAFQTAARIRIT